MSINPLWKDAIQSTPAIPDFFRKVLADDTPSEVIDLISQLLAFEPEKRITARQALSHPFFSVLHQRPASSASENRPSVVCSASNTSSASLLNKRGAKRPSSKQEKTSKQSKVTATGSKKQSSSSGKSSVLAKRTRSQQQLQQGSNSTQKSTTPETDGCFQEPQQNKRRKKTHCKKSLATLPLTTKSGSEL